MGAPNLLLATVHTSVFQRGSAETDRNYQGGNRSSTRLQQYRHLDDYIGFREERKHLRKIPLQQEGWKTLVYIYTFATSLEIDYFNS